MLDTNSKNSYNNSMKTIVSEKGQITVPKALRERLGIVPGTVLELRAAGGALVARKRINADPVHKWRGAVKLPAGQTVDEYLAMVRDGHGT